MRERVTKLIGSTIHQIWIGTFHATCVNILREDCERIGLEGHFVIFDRQMQDELISECLRDLKLGGGRYQTWFVRDVISAQKSQMKPLDQLEEIRTREGEIIRDTEEVENLSNLIKLYQNKLEGYSALDFDDILIYAVRLLRESEEVRAKYHREIKHILVDEFQDINLAQYELLRLLTNPERNITVVADEDQSIYSWRGSSPRFIDSFMEEFDLRVIELRVHYRSTPDILNAAQAVIRHNPRHRTKELVTENPSGGSIIHYTVETPEDEANLVARLINRLIKEARYSPGDIAIFYRRHVLADTLEEVLARRGFKINRVRPEAILTESTLGRLIALLRFINWGLDLDLERAINFPKMIIDELNLARLKRLARVERVDLVTLIEDLDRRPDLIGPLTRIELNRFMDFVHSLSELTDRERVSQIGMELFRRLEPMRSPFRGEEVDLILSSSDPVGPAADLIYSTISRGESFQILTRDGLDSRCAAEVFRRVLRDYLGAEIAEGGFSISVDETLKLGDPPQAVEVEPDGSISLLTLRICQRVIEYFERPNLGDVVVYDLETIGKDPRLAEIIEIGALKLDEGGREVGRFYSLVKPKIPIPRSSSRVHGITDAEVRDAPSIEEVLPDFLDFIGSDILAGHNVEQFDNIVLDRALSRYLNSRLSNITYDTMKVAQRLYPRESSELRALASMFSMDHAQLHRAHRDAELTAKIMRRLELESVRRRVAGSMSELLPIVAVGIKASGDESPLAEVYLKATARYLKASSIEPAILDGLPSQDRTFAERILREISRTARREEVEDAEWNAAKSELMNRIIRFENQGSDKSLSAFLDYHALLAGVDEYQLERDKITLMTLHSAKGTEFPVVIIIGMEEGELPLYSSPPELLEEERRLCYVGMTRAKERLYMVTTRWRRGIMEGTASRFVGEMPSDLVGRWP
jgi:DNA polymerase III epsilon subunit family exonuclease